MSLATPRALAKAIAGANAFVLGRRFAEEWAQGTLDLRRELTLLKEREGAGTATFTVWGIVVTGATILKDPRLAALALAGLLVGSGALQRALAGGSLLPSPRALRSRRLRAPAASPP